MTDFPKEPTPEEVVAIASKIIALIGEHIATTPEVLTAALKATAVIVDEARAAHFSAQMRAAMINQYGRRPP